MYITLKLLKYPFITAQNALESNSLISLVTLIIPLIVIKPILRHYPTLVSK